MDLKIYGSVVSKERKPFSQSIKMWVERDDDKRERETEREKYENKSWIKYLG